MNQKEPFLFLLHNNNLKGIQPNSTTMDSSPATSSISSATQEFLKGADPGKDSKKRSATSSNNTTSSSSTNERSLAEVISEKFLPFDSETYIVAPFGAELARDGTVDEGMCTRIYLHFVPPPNSYLNISS